MTNLTVKNNYNNALANPKFKKLAGSALKHLENSRAEQTLKSYDSDFEHFKNWCKKSNLEYLPCSSETFILYIEHLISQGFKYSTLERRKTSINIKHKERNFNKPFNSENENLRLWWQGVRRSLGLAVEKKKPILADDLKKLINICSKSKNVAKAKRDIALLLIGFTGCMRRSEIVALNIRPVAK